MSVRLASIALVAGSSVCAVEAQADDFATPPGESRPAVVVERNDFLPRRSFSEADPKLSIVRFLVGPAGKFDPTGVSPGLFVAAEVGRGAAGGRLSAAWLDVGAQNGLSQYTAEIALDFGGSSRFRPTIGAGGGVVRTSASKRPDGSIDTETGATIGIGLVRAGLGFRLPFDSIDARTTLDVIGSLPAIRGSSAPDITPWVLTALTVGIGF